MIMKSLHKCVYAILHTSLRRISHCDLLNYVHIRVWCGHRTVNHNFKIALLRRMKYDEHAFVQSPYWRERSQTLPFVWVKLDKTFIPFLKPCERIGQIAIWRKPMQATPVYAICYVLQNNILNNNKCIDE